MAKKGPKHKDRPISQADPIAGYKTAQGDLKHSSTIDDQQHFFKAVLTTFPDILLIINIQNKEIVYSNFRENILGLDTSVNGRELYQQFSNLLYEDDIPTLNQRFFELAKSENEKVLSTRFRIYDNAGQMHWFQENAIVFRRDEKNFIVELLLIIREITQEVEAQQLLHESELKYRNYINLSIEGIYYMNTGVSIQRNLPPAEQVQLYYENAFIAECNESFAKSYGYDSKDEIIGTRIFDLHSDHFEINKASFEILIKNGYRIENQETIEPDVNGNFRYFLNNAFGILKDDCLVGIWGTQKDISDKRLAEKALKENEALLKAILTALPDMKFRLNKDGVILNYLPSTEKNETVLLPEQFLGKNLADIAPDYIYKAVMYNVRKCIEEKNVQIFECLAKIKEENKYFEARCSMINEEEVVLVVRNIDDRKRAYQSLEEKIHELDAKNRQLEEYVTSNEALENFAYIASHDLKEPLRTMYNFAQILQKQYGSQLDEEAQTFIQYIVSGADKLNKLIEDLLAYSRVNNESPVLSSIEPRDLFGEVLYDLSEIIRQKRATIELGPLPVLIRVNPSKFKRLLQNLISNAIKFSSSERPLMIKIEGEDWGQYWRFLIEDNGIGIPEDYLEKIFSLFKKLHYGGNYEGTGLGLAICKKIVEQHFGDIWVESTFGRGSRFYFTILK